MSEPLQNEHGEIPDCGPPWACNEFGLPGHDYLECPHCRGQYAGHLESYGVAP